MTVYLLALLKTPLSHQAWRWPTLQVPRLGRQLYEAEGSERVSQSRALKMRRTKRVSVETEAAAVTYLTNGWLLAEPSSYILQQQCFAMAGSSTLIQSTFVTRRPEHRLHSESLHAAAARALLASGLQHLPKYHTYSFPTLPSPISPHYLINLLGQSETAD